MKGTGFMGNSKWVFLAGLGAGAALALRLSEKQISGIKNFASQISNSENAAAAKRVAGEKISSLMRTQGANLVDKLADSLKSQLNNTADDAPFSSTTSTSDDGTTRDKDGHIIIDGKIVP